MTNQKNADIHRTGQIRAPTMLDCTATIDDEIIPTGTQELPYKSIYERAKAACQTVTMLKENNYHDDGGEPPREEIEGFMQAIASSKPTVAANNMLTSSLSTPAGAYAVSRILREYEQEVVKDSKTLRVYVTNKLIIETNDDDPRVRLRALELLGKISDVGLFTDRTELTLNNRSTSDLESSLREKLKRLTSYEDVEAREVKNEDGKPEYVDSDIIIAPPIHLKTPLTSC